VADTHDLIFDVLKDDYPNVDFDRVCLVLVNAGERILTGLDRSLANAASRRLASQEVEVINYTVSRVLRTAGRGAPHSKP
jgi:NADH dehydrogenase FAD-containing subunit